MSKLPAIFFGHGNPMNAIDQNKYTEKWAEIGKNIPKPKAVLCISAHWYIPATAVTAMKSPPTIHDFGGFPQELFDFQYPAPGSIELAERVSELLDGDVTFDTETWGLDHGAWSVLCHVFPNADVPVIQLSIDSGRPPAFHYELGKKLKPLREEGVLVVGSGNLVHNLHAYAWGTPHIEPFEWALTFEETARDLIDIKNHLPLINYESLGREAALSIPTPDHYLPLLYILGMQDDSEKATFPFEGFDGGSISMTSVLIS